MPFDVVCHRCDAIKFKEESAAPCCVDGNVYLTPQQDPPDEIQTLYSQPAFLRLIRKYNGVFVFTSMGANIDKSLANTRSGVYTFLIHGTISHRIGSLMPNSSARPMSAQMYVFDGDMENQATALQHFQRARP